MEHICVSGRSSIFAVQTVVRSYMLKMLQKRINDKNAEKKMVEALDKFLKWIDSLRNDIEYSKESFSFVHAHVSSCLERFNSGIHDYSCICNSNTAAKKILRSTEPV